MYGAKNASRMNHFPREARSVSSAKMNDRITSGGVVRSVNTTVCHIECQKSVLVNASL